MLLSQMNIGISEDRLRSPAYLRSLLVGALIWLNKRKFSGLDFLLAFELLARASTSDCGSDMFIETRGAEPVDGIEDGINDGFIED